MHDKSSKKGYHLNTEMRNLIKNSDNDLGNLRSSSESLDVIDKPIKAR